MYLRRLRSVITHEEKKEEKKTLFLLNVPIHRLGINVSYFSAQAPVNDVTKLNPRAHTAVGSE